MGSAIAGKWIIIILIYFAVFLTVVTSAVQMDANITYSGGEFLSDNSNVPSLGCSSPRYGVNSASGEIYEVVGSGKKIDTCWSTMGSVDGDICNSIEGCTWTNETTWIWFIVVEGSEYYCDGNLNETYYGYTSEDVVKNDSLCSLDFFQTNKSACENIGCTYGYSEKSPDMGYDGIVSVVTGLFTFNVDLNIPDGGKVYFSFFLFYLPLFILILGIYFALPFAH